MIVALVASIFPAICGWLICVGCVRQRLDVRTVLMLLAPGTALGWALVALGMRGFATTGHAHLWTACMLVLIAIVVGLLYRWQRPAPGHLSPSHVEPILRSNGWYRVVWWTLLVLLVLGLFLALGELLERPLYPWDAWSAWAVKTRVWFELGQQVQFVGPQQWLEAGTAAVNATGDSTASSSADSSTNSAILFTNDAWQYPETFPLIQLWTLRWISSWQDSLMNLPSWLLIVTILLSSYAVFRRLGAGPVTAMMACYVLGSLPLLNAHLALAGYADLWLACALWVFGLGGVMWFGSHDSGARQHGWLIVALPALALALALKREGIIWAAVIVAGLGVAQLSVRLRIAAAAGLLLVVGLWLLLGGFAFELPGIGGVVLAPGEITVPFVGSYSLEFSNQFAAFIDGLLLDPNWHLAWYGLPPLTIFLLWQCRASPLATFAAVVWGLSIAFLFVLFFFTGAAVWAESMTASNRLMLQITPLLMVLSIALLLRYLGESAASTSR